MQEIDKQDPGNQKESSRDRYQELFIRLASAKQRAFIPYAMLGYPDYDSCLDSIKCMIENGADALELGLAFSDPLADGPIIQDAAARTISSGFSSKEAFKLLAAVREADRNIPICLMTYYNPVLAAGAGNFLSQASKAGVDAILIVDLPLEEAAAVAETCKEYKIKQVFIVSPLTSQARLKALAAFAGAFIYAVSRLGVTGVEENYDRDLEDLIANSKALCKLPVIVGFGISSPEQAKRICALGADGVICGSRIIKLMSEQSQKQELAEFIREMAKASRFKA